MTVRGSLALGVVAFAAMCVVTGCAFDGGEVVVVQERQLKEYAVLADAAGAEIIAQISDSELEPAHQSRNIGGVRLVSDYYEEWPKYYYWAQIIELKADGPRTPTQVSDDLNPWLKEQGWKRNTDSEFPPTEESFERDYYRDGYHLIVRVDTVPPPDAQTLMFTIVTPHTDPGRG